MPVQILMPALSPTMEVGKLAKWLVSEGQAIKSGMVIAEIETDKATMEVEAVDEGTLARILVPEGSEDVKVNTPIALLVSDGETAAPTSRAPEPAASAPEGAAPSKPAAAPSVASSATTARTANGTSPAPTVTPAPPAAHAGGENFGQRANF